VFHPFSLPILMLYKTEEAKEKRKKKKERSKSST
jgi:hypothetical protein